MRILVVEDEQKIAHSIKKGLQQEGMVVELAFDGKEGFEMGKSSEFDVIVLDLMLPLMDGMEVCSQLRKQNVTSPILMLTAKGLLDDKVNGLNAGADDYLVKPFAFAELIARIRALARRPKEVMQPTMRVADLEMNVGTYEVTRNGNPIHLSRKEFALLEFLLRNVNQIVTKEQLMNNLWSYDADVLPNTIEVYIGYLRTKIDKAYPDLSPLIHTVRGFGYKLATTP